MFNHGLKLKGGLICRLGLLMAFSVSVVAGFQSHMAGGPGRFDSIGGSYDTQTDFSFFKTLYYQARSRSIIGKLSKAGAPGSAAVEDMRAGDDSLSLQGSSVVARAQISSGDMMRYTIQEHAKGTPTYGDFPVRRGDFLAYKNMEARVNNIDSPAIPVVGEMAQQRVRGSITDLPAAVKEEVLNYMEEQLEIEFLISLLYGASPSALLPTSQGGLGVTLGVNSAGTAGQPLMGRHYFTPQGGYLTYNSTPSTWNAAINTAIAAITTGAGGYVTLPLLKQVRAKLDDIRFRPVMLGGKKYKGVALCDSDLWYRIDHLLATYYQNSMPREKGLNPIFDLEHQLFYDGMLFLNVPNLKLFRPAADVPTGYPSIGPGMTSDPRSYTPSSLYAPMIILGQKAVVEGYNDSLTITTEEGEHKKGMEIAGHMKEAFIRSEWYAKDGRTGADAVYCDNVFTALFYEPGVGTGY